MQFSEGYSCELPPSCPKEKVLKNISFQLMLSTWIDCRAFSGPPFVEEAFVSSIFLSQNTFKWTAMNFWFSWRKSTFATFTFWQKWNRDMWRPILGHNWFQNKHFYIIISSCLSSHHFPGRHAQKYIAVEKQLPPLILCGLQFAFSDKLFLIFGQFLDQTKIFFEKNKIFTSSLEYRQSLNLAAPSIFFIVKQKRRKLKTSELPSDTHFVREGTPREEQPFKYVHARALV